MKKIFIIFILLYFLVCLISIISKYFNLDFFIFIKPFTLPVIIALFIINFIYYKKLDNTVFFILIGIIFGYVADIIFIKESNSVMLFLSGLLFFLLGHIFYIIGFFKTKIKLNFIIIILMLLFLISWLTFILGHRWNKLELKLLISVIIYSSILSLMFLTACNFELNQDNKFGLISLGALIFVASDMIISYLIFINQFKHGEIAVLITYFTAQGFIGFKTIYNYTDNCSKC